jgi:hypothetical protein
MFNVKKAKSNKIWTYKKGSKTQNNLNAWILFPIWIIQYIFSSAIKKFLTGSKTTTITESFYGFTWKLCMFFGCEEGNTNMLQLAECHSTSLTFTSYQIKERKCFV